MTTTSAFDTSHLLFPPSLPISFTKGEGVWLYDKDNNAYLDTFAGVAVNSLGHNHPALINAFKESLQMPLHLSNYFAIPQQLTLANYLIKHTGLSKVFFVNSGAEANEMAIKAVRLYGHTHDIETPSIIVMENAFHGRTMATLSASGSRRVQAGFEPLVPGFVRAPYNHMLAIERIAANREDIAAIMVEPIQGEGGVNIPGRGYLKKLRQLCDKHQWLLILDEVQTGNGRTGNLYAYQAEDICPDILTTAKGLGGGMPVAACLFANKALGLFKEGQHGTTFGGNPLACHIAYTVLKIIETENLIVNAARMGEYLLSQLKEELREFPHIKDIRGKGLMIGIELDRPCKDLMYLGLEEKILLNVTAGNILRVVPALIINQKECDQIAEKIKLVMKKYFF